MNTSTNEASCQCITGWTGKYCERKVNFCENVTCQNGGVCRPLFNNYKCECLTSSYSGRYCEIVSNGIMIQKIVTKSVSYIAIIAIALVFGFVLCLDILKYVFKIDVTKKELEQLRREKALKKKFVRHSTPIRYVYVN